MSSTATQEIDVSMPEDLESGRAKLVYLYLAVTGGATADEMQDELELDKGAVLSITGTLRKRGHLQRREGQYEPA